MECTGQAMLTVSAKGVGQVVLQILQGTLPSGPGLHPEACKHSKCTQTLLCSMSQKYI